MKIHVITIFPESFDSYFNSSIIWNAKNKWIFQIELYKLNDYSTRKQKRVDSKAYWMHWQVIESEPLSKAIEYIFSEIWEKVPVIYMSPRWNLLNQEKIEDYYNKLHSNDFIIICWHYEWIDQRIIDIYVDFHISIGNYVISSWELASMVFLDSLLRNIPGILWNKLSLEEDSFWIKLNRQKEYPVYTKPENFMWNSVPKILLSGNHKEIEKWKINNLW